MKEYLSNYVKKLEEEIKNKHKFTKEEIENIKFKITCFNHERLIHLIVTVNYVLLSLTFLTLGMVSYIFLIPFIITLIFLLFYIPHYFFLENSTQYLYKLLDQVKRS